MTVQPVVLSNIDRQALGGNAIKAQWGSLANGDTGAPISACDFADRSMQVEGTFGSGGTAIIEGTNDGIHYETLHDQAGVALSWTSGAIKFIAESVILLRPNVTGGDNTTSLTFTGSFRRQQPQ